MALTAGGIALVFVMPMAGYATGKISARTLAVAGFILFVVSFRYAADVTNLEMTFPAASWLRVVQMLPIPFCFISITNAAYVGMPREQSNQVSGLQHPDRRDQRAGDQPVHVAPGAPAERHAVGVDRLPATHAGAQRLLRRRVRRGQRERHGAGFAL
jgi:hypothetical protein